MIRTALFAATVSALLGVATADDDENVTNTTAPTSAPTTLLPPGVTVLTWTAIRGSVCIQVQDTQGFAAVDLIQIGLGVTSGITEFKQIVQVYDNTFCGKALNSRRLGPKVAGSFKLDSPTINGPYIPGTVVKKLPPPSYGSTCFPGDATVDVYGRGATHMASVSVGDRVRVENGKFEPVLSFLHKVPGVAMGLTLVHAQGTFQASENHIVFTSRGDMPMSALRPGDELLVQSGPSPILAIGQASTATGMYAPFTASGSLVVDGVIASNYGTPTSKVSLPHAAAHAAFFSLRVYHYLDVAMIAKVLGSLAVVMMFPHLRSYKL